jgi:hypothetical protein
VDVRVSWQHESEFHAFTAFKIKQLGAAVHGNYVRGYFIGCDDLCALQFGFERLKLGSRATGYFACDDNYCLKLGVAARLPDVIAQGLRWAATRASASQR